MRVFFLFRLRPSPRGKVVGGGVFRESVHGGKEEEIFKVSEDL